MGEGSGAKRQTMKLVMTALLEPRKGRPLSGQSESCKTGEKGGGGL